MVVENAGELQAFRIIDSEIFSCSACRGAWIPWNVIREATRSVALTKSYPTSVNSTASRIVCPRDGCELRELTELGVRIEQCPTCNGLWLDQGELAALRNRRVRLVPPPASENSGQTYAAGDDVVTVVESVLEGLGTLFLYDDF